MADTEFGAPIGVMEIQHDIRRVEQRDQVLGQIGRSIDAQIAFAQEHRSRFGDGERCAYDRVVNIGELRWRIDPLDVTIARKLRNQGAYHFRVGDPVTDGLEHITRNRRIQKNSAHALQAALEIGEQHAGVVLIEHGNVGERPLYPGPIGPNCRQDLFTAAHVFSPRFARCQLWNVCLGGCGTSRPLPQALSPL